MEENLNPWYDSLGENNIYESAIKQKGFQEIMRVFSAQQVNAWFENLLNDPEKIHKLPPKLVEIFEDAMRERIFYETLAEDADDLYKTDSLITHAAEQLHLKNPHNAQSTLTKTREILKSIPVSEKKIDQLASIAKLYFQLDDKLTADQIIHDAYQALSDIVSHSFTKNTTKASAEFDREITDTLFFAARVSSDIGFTQEARTWASQFLSITTFHAQSDETKKAIISTLCAIAKLQSEKGTAYIITSDVDHYTPTHSKDRKRIYKRRLVG